MQLCVLLAIAAAATVATSPAALAHDHLVTSTPRNGSVVRTLPDTVILTFEETPTAGYTKVRVTDPRGKVVSSSPTTDGSIVTVALTRDPVAGAYRVVWSVLSDDGHPVAGVVTFTVTPATTSAPAAAATSSAVRGGGTWIIAVIGAIAALGIVASGRHPRGER
jgi:methionine-rich copper-binding protein CopC